ncbi:NAD(P)-binding protein [Xylariomycetidae sp. FL2044]|nr:NAD(P)-binding protein [Xylariomycetidae sp. FL2044]
MRDPTKTIRGIAQVQEEAAGFRRIQANLQKPETVTQAVRTAGVKPAFIYLVHGAPDYLQGAIAAMKATGLKFVVFLSSFTILTDKPLRAINPPELLAHKSGIVAGNVKIGQKNIVYLYGPKFRSMQESVVTIGKVLGKDLSITTLLAKEGYENFISLDMPPQFADFMVKNLSTKRPDKGHGERVPRYEEDASNLELYTGRPATALGDWVKENQALFEA